MPTQANNEIIDALQAGVNSANEVNLVPKPMDSVVQTGDIIIDIYQQDGGAFGAVIADSAGIFVGGAVAGTLSALVIKAALMSAAVPGYGPGIAIWILYEGQAIVLEVNNNVSDYVANELLEELRAYSRDDLREDIWDSLQFFDELYGAPGYPMPISNAIADAANFFGRAFTSPIALDLNNNGLELSAVADGVYFDIDGDGFAEKTGWVKPADAFPAWKVTMMNIHLPAIRLSVNEG